MPDGVDRESLSISLAERYLNQNVGGAYDAKKATTSTYHNDNPPSALAQTVENNPEFVTNQQIGVSNFKGTEEQQYKEISNLSQNVGSSTYNANNPEWVSQKANQYDKTSNFQTRLHQQSPSNFKGINNEFRQFSTYDEQVNSVKKVTTSTYDDNGQFVSLKANQYDKTSNFQTRLHQQSPSNFKGVNKDLTGNATYIEQVDLIKRNFNNNKYKP
jgi:hypothetical protein